MLSTVSALVVRFFLVFFYHFTVSRWAIIAGIFFTIPVFYYITIVYKLLRADKQYTVVLVSIPGTGISLLLNIIFIPLSPDGISGAIVAIAITQWLLLCIYRFIEMRYIRFIPLVMNDNYA